MVTHCTDRRYVCYVCDKQFTHAFSLKRHMKTHLDLAADIGIDVLPPPFPPHKHPLLDDEHSLLSRKDIDIVHEPASEGQKMQLAETKVWSCAVCCRRCGSRQTLKRHMLQHDGCVKAHTCSQCGKRFLATYELNRHLRCHDRQRQVILGDGVSRSIPPPSQFRTHSCTECGVEFSTARLVSNHMAICHPGLTHKPYSCSVCSKRFAHPYSLKRHWMQHVDGADVFACDACEKRFTTMYDRDRHARTHNTDRPYGCELCEKRFVQPHHLTNHMITHTGEKTFVCDVCKRCFAHSFTLKRHMNIHRRTLTTASSATLYHVAAMS